VFRSCYDHQTEKGTRYAILMRYSGVVQVAYDCLLVCMLLSSKVGLLSLVITGSNQAYRAISTSQLNALLRLHLWPIDVVVYHGPQGYLVLRGASRLDAFSGYPVRS
jgi:succinate dehydrogenase hydrophobic anchor subunit